MDEADFKQVIQNALCNGPLKEVEKRMQDEVKAFLARKFRVAFLKQNADVWQLEMLWRSIFNEDGPK